MVVSFSQDFEVKWKDPADAGLTWFYDPMHFPKPLVPLAFDFLEAVYDRFMSARAIQVNGYAFNTIPSPRPPTPEILSRGVVDVWSRDNLPRIDEFCHRVRSQDYDSQSTAQLAQTVGKMFEDAVETFGLTMTVITGFMGPTFEFVHFLESELGPEGPRIAATLLQGFENGTAAAGAGLSELAEMADKLPAVAEALRQGRYDSLESVEGGPAFMAHFRRYLDEFGWRVESWGDIERPTWSEDPRTPLVLISRYLADPQRSPAASHERALEQREEATREVESRLAPDKLPQFRELLAASQSHVPMSEDRALNQLIIIGSMRLPFLALGRRLAEADSLGSPNDIFYLTTDEMQEAASNPSPAVKATAERRRSDYERWATMTPPPFLGSPPDMSRMPAEMVPMATLFFGAAPPRVEGRTIKGQAASKGVVRARARVIHELSEADQLQQGEVLVCTTTAPPWTPLFAIAAAVVTDSGGMLSHSAICAREYAIPCVVATQVATKMIQTGAMLTVDGGNGTVTIEG